ncbi:MAG TPA: SufE family protein [Candidatus Merdimorpha stercoravium]|uniref:SufE family protein n=1 Tax=Candidatus Merdimorpha stercoravium TaxID=2840863 RepID=A0A9D1H9F3_9FLAO|nr:SufE family protein [Candidatus Merdimorpha stercoravium]
MKTIEENIAEIESDFSMFDEWVDKYAYLIDLGKSLPLIDAKYKDEDHLIRGCQSQVWLAAHLNDQGRIDFTADSDAIITKGIISLLVRVLSGQTPQDIAQADLSFIDRIGLSSHLSPTRANGLSEMIRQMKLYAGALSVKK